MDQENGPETISHITVDKELTSELVMAFCYNYIEELPKLEEETNI